MSEKGQTEKNSVRAYVFRFALELGHCSTQSACLKGAKRGRARRPEVRLIMGRLSHIPVAVRTRISPCDRPHLRQLSGQDRFQRLAFLDDEVEERRYTGDAPEVGMCQQAPAS